MSEISFKVKLARIKQDFHAKLIAHKRSFLSIQEVAQLLYKYMNGQPLTIRQSLLRSSGKNEISWDDLLQFLQQQLAIIQSVKKIQYSPLSATEITQNQTNQFSKLINYVKTKQTNAIQNIYQVPFQVSGSKIIAVCFQKELVFYDYGTASIISHHAFKYVHMKDKIMEKAEHKKIQLLNSQQINIEMSDHVEEIINLPQHNSKNMQHPTNFLTNNIKNSVRGSSLSSEKSSDNKLMFRRNTELFERRKPKTTTKIKNDDIKKVFSFFQQSSLQNSIHIAHAFVNARNNFQKCIVLENRFLEKDTRQRNFDLSSAKFHKNYQHQLSAMKRTNKHLSSARVNLSLQVKSRQSGNFLLRKKTIGERQYSRGKKQQTIQPLQMNNKQLEIIDISFYGQYLLISLFNREIRLIRLKRSLNRINEEPVFQKSFKDVVIYAKIYKSKNKQLFHIVVGLEKDNQSQVIAYRLDEQMKIKEKVFQHQFPFSAKYQSILPFGLALFNQLGYFGLIELNSSLEGLEQKLFISSQLFNPVTGNRISISQVIINEKVSSIFISCSSGYVYLYDRYTKQIKYYMRICQFPILDICLFHSDQQLLVLYGNGSMALLSTFHLEKIYLFQSYGEISNQSKIYKVNQDHFCIYNQRNITPYLLYQNQQKQFANIKSTKVFKSRLKLKNKQKRTLQKEKVLRVMQGRGGEQDFMAILLQKGEILIFNMYLDYVGSYYYFNVLHIVDIYSNKQHQFLALFLDNNTVQVVNLYTQNLLFNIKTIQTLNKNSLRADSSLHPVSMAKIKPKKNASQVAALIHFMDLQVSNCFLSIISKGGKVSNYSQKGLLVSVINLQERLGEFVQGQMVYDEQELVIASQTNLIVLYRKSYNRKCIIKVSQFPIVKIKKCQLPLYSLCMLDSNSNVFLGNAKQKNIKCINQGSGLNKYQTLLFNQLIKFRISEVNAVITRIRQKQEIELQINQEKCMYSIINKNVVQVNRFTGKMYVYNFSLCDFQEFIF